MFPKKIHLIRHAESVANLDGIVCGALDSPLTPGGRLHANKIATRFKSRGILNSTCFTSDLIRAKESARLLGFTNVVSLPGLRETDTGAASYIDTRLFNANHPEFAHHQTNLDSRYPGGETTREMLVRTWKTFEREILPKLAQEQEISIVAHGGPLNSIATNLLQMKFDAFPLFVFKNLSTLTLIQPLPGVDTWIVELAHED